MSAFAPLVNAPNCPTKVFHKTTYPAVDPTRPELSAKGKTIVITGGGTGIGAATATYFAKAGASHIAILGRREKPLLDTKASIEKSYPETKVLAIAADTVDKAATDAAFEKIAAASDTSKIDVLVSNAAVLGSLGTIATIDSNAWLTGVTTNLTINFNVTSAFLAHCKPDGVIIESNSSASHMDIAPGFSSYTVSKLATARFYQCVQFENPSMRIFCVQPGAVLTDMNKQSGYQEQKDGEGFMWNGQGAALLAKHDDASLPASFFVWLSSDEAEFLKGRYLWANWDVEELENRKDEILDGEFLKVGLQGWPFE
jgi:NAD(P)-dependent dehydrogenase (short-subunit alcohol dehydrogenase family)